MKTLIIVFGALLLACGSKPAPSTAKPTTPAEPECCCMLPDRSELPLEPAACGVKHGTCDELVVCSGITGPIP